MIVNSKDTLSPVVLVIDTQGMFVRIKSILSVNLVLFGGDTYKRISASAIATLHSIIRDWSRFCNGLRFIQTVCFCVVTSNKRTGISIKNGFERPQGQVLQWQRNTNLWLGNLEGKHFLYFITSRSGYL